MVSKIMHATYMRANPPHKGHELIIESARLAGDVTVVLSASQDNKANPLSPIQKLQYMKSAFPDTNLFLLSSGKSIFEFLVNTFNYGYEVLVLYLGSDRANEFRTMIKKYNGIQEAHGYYEFKEIYIVEVGNQRNDSSSDVDGYSSTKMRKAAVEGDREFFHDCAPSNLSVTEKDQLMFDVRAALIKTKNV